MAESEFPEDWFDQEEAPETQDEVEDAVLEDAFEAAEEELPEELPQEQAVEDELPEELPEEQAAGADDADADLDDEELAAIEAAACARWQASVTESAPAPGAPAVAAARSEASAAGRRSATASQPAKGSHRGEPSRKSGKGKGKGKEVLPPWRRHGSDLKRPAPPAPAPPAKRQATTENSRSAQAPPAAQAAPQQSVKVTLKRVVAEKLEQLRAQGRKLSSAAVLELAKADHRDALILLQALAKREQVQDPSKFVIVSLKKRAASVAAGANSNAPVNKAPAPAARTAVAKAPVAKAPAAKEPAAKVPVAKVPAAKPPVEKAPSPSGTSKLPAGVKVSRIPVANSPGSTKAPVAKTPPKAPITKAPPKIPEAKAPRLQAVPGVGQKPRLRTEEELDFFQMAVQAKLCALNKQGIWPGPHPLDEAALSALLQIEPDRALEILDEVEQQGKTLSQPSRFARELAAEEAADDS